MPTADRLTGEPVAAPIREAVAERVGRLGSRGVTPTLATVLASDDPADERFVTLKHEAAAAAGIAIRDVRVGPDGPDRQVVDAVDRLSGDDAVDAIFVQAPLPPGTDWFAVRTALDPGKDVDGLHPVNLGRLVAGEPRFVPATAAAVLELFEHYGVPTEGQDLVVVGRSAVIGRPLANLLWQRRSPGNATVTVCHTRTRDLGRHTREADIVVTAAGEPGLVDGSMLAPGATVVDVSANWVPADAGGGHRVAGDVNFERAAEVAGALTPVPGGVGPVTVATLLRNVVLAAERRSGEGWVAARRSPADGADTDSRRGLR